MSLIRKPFAREAVSTAGHVIKSLLLTAAPVLVAEGNDEGIRIANRINTGNAQIENDLNDFKDQLAVTSSQLSFLILAYKIFEMINIEVEMNAWRHFNNKQKAILAATFIFAIALTVYPAIFFGSQSELLPVGCVMAVSIAAMCANTTLYSGWGNRVAMQVALEAREGEEASLVRNAPVPSNPF